ncbi:Gmad2 immunoglobulin-like domain-containing protein [Agromyces neolithicus]|uniref:Bacterial spore germination immunoglobulin-like domain-containing protein n=1 Tax=Agromyces neolithicus TaxID=269420 RepID=A0ABP4XZT5_9MICO
MVVRSLHTFAVVAVVLAVTACASGPTSGPDPSPSPVSNPATSTAPTPSEPPQITIGSPVADATVSVPFTVSGTANTFEAALTVDAVDESGMVACVRHVTATSGSGTPGTWEATLAFGPEENALPVMLRAYTHSAKDGSVVDLVEYPITVSPDRPPIIMTSPSCGQVYDVGGLMLVTGTANLFEAALTVDVRNASGTTVATLQVTAEECCVESNFDSRLMLPDDIRPGLYDVVAYSLSAKDGRVENEFPVQIEIRG